MTHKSRERTQIAYLANALSVNPKRYVIYCQILREEAASDEVVEVANVLEEMLRTDSLEEAARKLSERTADIDDLLWYASAAIEGSLACRCQERKNRSS